MTVNYEFPRIEYVGNGTTFAYSFLWSSAVTNEIYVELNGIPLTEGIEYELEDYTPEYGGNIVFYSVPVIGDDILIYRFTPRTQQIRYDDDQPFPTEAHEFQCDKDTRILQELFASGSGGSGVVNLSALPLATQVQIINSAGSDAFIDMWTTDGLLAGVSAGEVVAPGGSVPADGAPSTKPEGYIYYVLEALP